MLSLKVITLAYIIGILWGLYLELNTLIVTSIFLLFLWPMFFEKFHYEIILLSSISILGCLYINTRTKEYDSKYIDDMIINSNIVITSQAVENTYTYEYNCKSDCGDRFIIYFNKNSSCSFKIGDYLKIEGKFNLPDVARNKGRI